MSARVVNAGGMPGGPLVQLRSVPAFESLSAAQLAALAAGVEEIVLQRGQPFFESGEPAEAMFLLLDGTARATVGDAASRVLGPGDVVGFMEMLAQVPASRGVTADTPVLALRLEFDALRDACDQHFGILAAILAHVAARASERRDTLEKAAGTGGGPGFDADHPMDRVDRILALYRSPVFPSAGLDALAELAGHLSERHLESGEGLWPPRDGPEGVFLIASGTVRLESAGWDGAVLLGAGGMPGLVTSLTDESGIRARAETPVKALYVAHETLLDILEDHSDMAFAFLGRLAGCVLEPEG